MAFQQLNIYVIAFAATDCKRFNLSVEWVHTTNNNDSKKISAVVNKNRFLQHLLL